MSRSRRKRSFVAVTTSRSEREDKKIWHGRWRTHERTHMAGMPLDDEDDSLPFSENQVSDVWQMSKDGHLYLSPELSEAVTRWRYR